MTQFKVKNKHLTGAIANFPKYIVQRMVDEQVRQGNPPNPRVFANHITADKRAGGFNWGDSTCSGVYWDSIITFKKFHLLPKPEKPKGHIHAKAMRKYAKDAMTSKTPWDKWEHYNPSCGEWTPLAMHPMWAIETQYRRKSEAVAEPKPVTPNEIIKAMLDKGLTVWACVSDESYADARLNLGKRVQRIVEVNDSDYPMRTASTGWVFAVPMNTATLIEITELP